MKDKYLWWGIVGLGVAVLLWYLTSQQIKSSTKIPYLVPQAFPNAPSNGASPTANTSIGEQPNIIGDHPNSTVPNGTVPPHANTTGDLPPGVNNNQMQFQWTPSLTNNPV